MKIRYLGIFFTLCMSCNLVNFFDEEPPEPTVTTGPTNSNNATNNVTNSNNATNNRNNVTANNNATANNNTSNQNNTTNNGTNNTTNQTTNQSNNLTNIGDYQPLITPGMDYLGSTEKFNAYYTDRNWKPKRVIFVDMTEGGSDFNEQSYDSPISMATALLFLQPGDLVFVKETLVPIANVNIRLDGNDSGNYVDPIVFYGERKPDGSLGVHFECQTVGASNASNSCFNIEPTNYIALDGFILEGGYYGVRTRGGSTGLSIINNQIFDQEKSGFSSGKTDWLSIESNTFFGAGTSGDEGHGIYLSRGSDWIVVRYNELYDSFDVDLVASGNPVSGCADINLTDIECHGSAKDGHGRGITEFLTISDNFFHHGKGGGPNYSSMKNSKISNNILGPYATKGASFWQRTAEPNLGSSNNEISGNLLVGHSGYLVQFILNSDANNFSNNIVLATNLTGTEVDADVKIIKTDGTTTNNSYTGNFYFSGTDIGHSLDPTENYSPILPLDLFPMGPFARVGHPEDLTPKDGTLGGWKPPILAPFPSPYSRE